jgi:hypothetical protein
MLASKAGTSEVSLGAALDAEDECPRTAVAAYAFHPSRAY